MFFAAALLGALLLNLALIFQARDAQEAPVALSLQPGLIWYLMRRWRWWGGTLALIVSALLQIYALRSLSVAVVQSMCAAGILIIPLYNAAFLCQRLGVSEIIAIALVIAGATVGSLTIPEQTADLRFELFPVFIGATIVSCLAFFLAKHFRSGIAISLVAAIGMSAAALLQKVLALSTVSGGRLALAIALLASCGGIGFLAQMSALQVAPVVQVAPTIMAVSTALPVFVAPMIFGESWPHPLLTSGALAVSVIAATWLSFLVSPSLAEPVSSSSTSTPEATSAAISD